MPAGRVTGEALAWQMGDMYARAELELWAMLSRRAHATPRDLAKVTELARLRIQSGRVLTATEQEMIDLAQAIIAETHQRATTAAVTELTTLGMLPPGIVRTEGITLLATALTDRLAHTHLPILRNVEDIYQRVMADTAALVRAGTHTRREATQAALDRYAALGIRGFRDSAGRMWGMDTYAEMATRTVAGRASVAAGLDVYASAGIDLVIVSDVPAECPLCTPWERQILTNGGPTTTQVVPNLLTGVPTLVTPKATVEMAMAAGLLHPNCRHTFTPYVPGASETVTERVKETNPATYAASQRQRYLERKVREWKRRAAVGNPRAPQRVRAYQARIRDLVAAHPDLRRLYPRERTPVGNPAHGIR